MTPGTVGGIGAVDFEISHQDPWLPNLNKMRGGFIILFDFDYYCSSYLLY